VYAQGHWPQGNRRHALDAKGFCRWLESRGMAFDQGERNGLCFDLSGSALRLHVVPHLDIAGTRRPGLQLLYRVGRWRGEWRVFMAFWRFEK
jgi:hypothetical protein